jgi:hypothetical protein
MKQKRRSETNQKKQSEISKKQYIFKQNEEKQPQLQKQKEKYGSEIKRKNMEAK